MKDRLKQTSGHWINAPQVCGSKESHQRVQLQEKGEKFLGFPSSIAYILQYWVLNFLVHSTDKQIATLNLGVPCAFSKCYWRKSQSGDRLADRQNLVFLDSVTRLTLYVRVFRAVCLLDFLSITILFQRSVCMQTLTSLIDNHSRLRWLRELCIISWFAVGDRGKLNHIHPVPYTGGIYFRHYTGLFSNSPVIPGKIEINNCLTFN